LQVPTRAKGTKNQRDSQPALTYEPGGRRFESCWAHHKSFDTKRLKRKKERRQSVLFEQFLAQRRYLKNVTPSTIEWYQTAFKALQKAHDTPTPVLTKSSLQQFVVSLRQRGVKPVSLTLNPFGFGIARNGSRPLSM
jgi:hypothetical protein